MYSNVYDSKVITPRGTWKTKSQGELFVLMAFEPDIFGSFFSYNPKELEGLEVDIRGFRIYTVRHLPKGQIGGTEFHRIRQEIIIGLEGLLWIQLEDIFGNSRIISVKPSMAVWLSPFILHTYKSSEDNSGLLVIANTLFDPANPATHDTYNRGEFEKIKPELIHTA